MNTVPAAPRSRKTSETWGTRLSQFLNSVTTEERAMWAFSIQMTLKEMKESAGQIAWGNWIGEYWQDRLDGLPVALDNKEAGAMVLWAIHLKSVFPEVVRRICEGPAPEMKNTSNYYFHELCESDIAMQYPGPAAALVLFLLKNPPVSFWDLDTVDKLSRKIQISPANRKDLLEICENLARLGHPRASSLRDSINADR